MQGKILKNLSRYSIQIENDQNTQMKKRVSEGWELRLIEWRLWDTQRAIANPTAEIEWTTKASKEDTESLGPEALKVVSCTIGALY